MCVCIWAVQWCVHSGVCVYVFGGEAFWCTSITPDPLFPLIPPPPSPLLLEQEGVSEPGADIVDSTWHRYDGTNFENGTLYMQRGWGPDEMFWTAENSTHDAVTKGNANWVKLHGSDRSTWPFNTNCCALNHAACACSTKTASTTTE